ncbi:PPOX class F420-dependent oxidoreductase [Micromonosporaceae bacterium Da 78-11]
MTQDTAGTVLLGAQRFVALTTFKRSGEAVATTVWVARDGAELIVLTPAQSWKVKRIRNNPAVQLVPCSRSGKVTPGVEPVDGTAVIEPDPATTERLHTIVKQKYGLEYKIITTIERLFGGPKPRVILRISPATRQ